MDVVRGPQIGPQTPPKPLRKVNSNRSPRSRRGEYRYSNLDTVDVLLLLRRRSVATMTARLPAQFPGQLPYRCPSSWGCAWRGSLYDSSSLRISAPSALHVSAALLDRPGV